MNCAFRCEQAMEKLEMLSRCLGLGYKLDGAAEGIEVSSVQAELVMPLISKSSVFSAIFV